MVGVLLRLKIISMFLNCNVLDEMGGRINELEKSISELKTEMGAEVSPSPVPPPKTEDVKTEEGSA